MVRGCSGAAAVSPGLSPACFPRCSGTGFPVLEAKCRCHFGRRDAPFFRRTVLGDGPQLAREDLAPDDDRSVGAPEALVTAIGDASLARLHGDVLDDGEIGMLD